MPYREQVLAGLVSVVDEKFGEGKSSRFSIYEYMYKKPYIIDEIVRKRHANEALWPECMEAFFVRLQVSLDIAVNEYKNVKIEQYSDDDECMGRRIPIKTPVR
jgi:uncharacterized protein with FMN-binding domain